MDETEKIIVSDILKEYSNKYYILIGPFLKEVNRDIKNHGIECEVREYNQYEGAIRDKRKLQLNETLSN